MVRVRQHSRQEKCERRRSPESYSPRLGEEASARDTKKVQKEKDEKMGIMGL